MRIEASNEQERLEFFQNLFEDAKSASEVDLDKLERHYQQYKGSTEIDGSEEKATVVRNITYELIESQVSSYIPNPSVTPKTASERNTRLAKSIETLCKNKRDELPFEMLNDLDERYNPIYGGSVWLVEFDSSIVTHNTVGDIKVTCLAPKQFIGEPNIYTIDDMDYCFTFYETTKDTVVRKYNVSYEDADEAVSDVNGADENSVTVYICYYRDEDGKIGQFVWSGDKVLVDITDFFARKVKVCQTCGKREQLCTCKEDGNKPKIKLINDEVEMLDQPVIRSDGSIIPIMSPMLENGQPVYEEVQREALDANGQMMFENVGGVMMPKTVTVQVPKMQETKIPWYTPDVFPIVIRKNTSEEGSLFGQSDCEFIRPQQQAINKVESRIMMKLMRSSVTPVIPEDATVTINNNVFGNVIRMRPGQSAAQYGVVDTTPNIAQDIAEADRLYDQAKLVLGISASFQGQPDTTAQSGKAKMLQIQQAAGRLDSKRQMKNAAYAEIDKIMFKLYLAYADEPREYSFRDAFGRWQNIRFSRYDFVEQDESGKWFYNDAFLFSADASVDIDKSRDFIWQENSRLFQMGAFGDPASPEAQLIFWQNNEAAKYPFAHDNVERLKEVINAQRQAAMQQEALYAAQAENEALSQEVANRTGYAEYLYNTIQGGQPK